MLTWVMMTVMCPLCDLSAVEKQELFPHIEHGEEAVHDQALTLDQCYALALKHSPLLQQLEKQVRVARYQALADLNPYIPQVSVLANGGVRRSDISVSNPTGEDRFHQLQASFSQLIYAFGRRASQLNLGKAQEELAQLDLAYQKSVLQMDVEAAFSALLLLKEKQKTLQKALELSELEWETAKAKLQAGSISESEARRSEIEVLQAKVVLDELQQSQMEQQGQLDKLVGWENVNIKGILGDHHPHFHVETQAMWLNKGLPLKIIQHQESMAKEVLKLLSGQSKPTLSAFATADRFGGSWTDSDHDWRAGLQFDWSLSGSWAQTQSTRAQQAALLQFKDIHRDEMIERKRRFKWFQDREKKLVQRSEHLKRIVDLRERNYKSTLLSFKAGIITYPLVEEARQALTNSELDLQQNLYDLDAHGFEVNFWSR
jgi:outer membrane protein TolC